MQKKLFKVFMWSMVVWVIPFIAAAVIIGIGIECYESIIDRAFPDFGAMFSCLWDVLKDGHKEMTKIINEMAEEL